MNMNQIIDTLTDILMNNFFEVKYKDNDDDLIEAGMDSIKVINLILIIEDEFNFEFKDEDLLLENFRTVNCLAKYIFMNTVH